MVEPWSTTLPSHQDGNDLLSRCQQAVEAMEYALVSRMESDAHHAICAGSEAAGAVVGLADWTGHANVADLQDACPGVRGERDLSPIMRKIPAGIPVPLRIYRLPLSG